MLGIFTWFFLIWFTLIELQLDVPIKPKIFIVPRSALKIKITSIEWILLQKRVPSIPEFMLKSTTPLQTFANTHTSLACCCTADLTSVSARSIACWPFLFLWSSLAPNSSSMHAILTLSVFVWTRWPIKIRIWNMITQYDFHRFCLLTKIQKYKYLSCL